VEVKTCCGKANIGSEDKGARKTLSFIPGGKDPRMGNAFFDEALSVCIAVSPPLHLNSSNSLWQKLFMSMKTN